jgi:hypothetical protein
MPTDVNEYEPDVLRVLQSKDETKAYYNKIAKVYDLLAEHSEQPMREKGLALLAAQPGQRILEIGFGGGTVGRRIGVGYFGRDAAAGARVVRARRSGRPC